MNPVEESKKLIAIARKLFDDIPLGRDNLALLADLEVQLHQPCELAIAGKVKAGKSSFLNALIGEDLAKVGDAETTATINRFCYGRPEFPDSPVKVVWDDGHITFESLDFMDSLQGRSPEVLKKAMQIDYLEYRLEHPILRELTIVDTPGTGAVVDEHIETAEKYFNLREKHKLQTRVCTAHADAVVYLMGAVANMRDKAFLDDFRNNTADGMAINAIGVLSRVDENAEVLADRENQAEYLADSLKQQLSLVIPISAGLHKAVKEKRLLFPTWKRLIQTIPPKTMDMMLKKDSMFTMAGFSNISVETRQDMKSGMPWSVFRTIIKTLYQANSVEEAIKEMQSIANIDKVRDAIDNYFFKRSKQIRCSRVLAQLYELCIKVQTLGLFQLRKQSAQLERWENFARRNGADDLAAYLKKQSMSTLDIDALERMMTETLKAPIERLQRDIQQADKDFQALCALQANRDMFTEEEQNELNALFGIRSVRFTIDYVMERRDYWSGELAFVNADVKRQIIHHAIEKYSRY